MALIRSTNTKPELAIRRALYKAGYRYRLYGRGLPGRPDLVFHGRRKVIFVHGCFWHRHAGCKASHVPKSRTAYWTDKLDLNVIRDERNITALRSAGWDVLVLWECEIRRLAEIVAVAAKFLGPAKVEQAPPTRHTQPKRL